MSQPPIPTALANPLASTPAQTALRIAPPLNLKRVHLVGIGGTGQSGLARLLHSHGIAVSGSDPVPSATTERLIADGIDVSYVQDGSAIHGALDLVVITAACREDNPDLVAARDQGIAVVKYAQMLGRLMREHIGIGVAGTHGKTTTSSMLACAFTAAGKSPSFCIGGEPKFSGVNARRGRGYYFIAEACEYDRSFLQLNPLIGLITNLEADHLDYYRDLDEIVEAFTAFVRKMPTSGVLIANGQCANTARVIERAVDHLRVVTFGVEGMITQTGRTPDYLATNLREERGCYTFTVSYQGRALDDVRLGVPGRQNVANAIAVYATAAWVGLDLRDVRAGLEAFNGVRRRFDLRGTLPATPGVRGARNRFLRAPSMAGVAAVDGVPLVDDYAHHPTEITATLNAARRVYPDKHIWAVFQPHQIARTQLLFEEFAQSLALADRVLLMDVYAAREKDADTIGPMLCRRLIARLHELGTDAGYHASFEDVLDQVRWDLPPDAAVLTLGAGTITDLADLALGANANAA